MSALVMRPSASASIQSKALSSSGGAPLRASRSDWRAMRSGKGAATLRSVGCKSCKSTMTMSSRPSETQAPTAVQQQQPSASMAPSTPVVDTRPSSLSSPSSSRKQLSRSSARRLQWRMACAAATALCRRSATGVVAAIANLGIGKNKTEFRARFRRVSRVTCHAFWHYKAAKTS
eukprot:5995784-Prymnesium_polylepis.1